MNGRLPTYEYVRQIIPAQPGWFYVEPIYGDVPGLDETPVIAWAIEAAYAEKRNGGGVNIAEATPILGDRLFGCAGRWAIKRPDGVYSISEEDEFHEPHELLAHWGLVP